MAKRKQRTPPPRTNGRRVAGVWQPDYGQGIADAAAGKVPAAAMALPASSVIVRPSDFSAVRAGTQTPNRITGKLGESENYAPFAPEHVVTNRVNGEYVHSVGLSRTRSIRAWFQVQHRTPKQYVGASKDYLDGVKRAEKMALTRDTDRQSRILRNACVNVLGEEHVREFERAGGRLADLVAAIEKAGAV
jgi:hypothetical protein